MSATTPGTDTQPDPLRLLHWNIHSWRDAAGEPNMNAIAELISEMKPQVVSLVEVDEEWNEPSMLDALAERCGYTPIFTPAFEYGHDQPRGGFGNALLTALPILAVRQRQLVWPVPTYARTEKSEPRSVVLAKVNFHGQPLWIGSTHLPRADARARDQALQRLKVILAGLEDPWILCGDFNAPAASWLELDDQMKIWPDPPAATYPANEPVGAIDYCVAHAGLLVEAQVLGVTGSDHVPIMVIAQF